MGMVKTRRTAIGRYWISAEGRRRLRSFWVDEDGSTCFACGFDGGLERAHLVPYEMGGADEPANLVILCRRCHKDAPDLADPTAMLRWIERRESYNDYLSREFVPDLRAELDGLSGAERAGITSVPWPVYMGRVVELAEDRGSHSGRMAAYAWAAAEAAREFAAVPLLAH